MRGAAAHAPEIIGRAHNAATEMIAPDAIYDDARGERILRIDDPLREFRTRCPRIGRQLRRTVGQQHAERPHAHSLALVLIVAARQYVNRTRLLEVIFYGVKSWEGIRHPVLDLFELRFHLDFGVTL